MSESKNFPWVDCTEIPVRTFLLQFAAIINQIVPPAIVKKYFDVPMNVITTSMEEIAPKLLQYYTIEDMHKAFMELSDQQQHCIVQSLEMMYIEFGTFSDNTLILVPKEPKDYIKPFFSGKLNIRDLLIN